MKKYAGKRARGKKGFKVSACNKKMRAARLKVWHIFHFAERYELRDDVLRNRTSPLLYTKDFCMPSDNETVSHSKQLDALRRQPNFLELSGLFTELKRQAGNWSRAFRGYLLDELMQPASNAKIAEWFNIPLKKMETLLESLEKSGLIEYVTCPEFDPLSDRKNEKSGTIQEEKKTKKRRIARNGAQGRATERRRTQPLYKGEVKGEVKGKGDSLTAIGKGKSKRKKKTAKRIAEKLKPKVKTSRKIKTQTKSEGSKPKDKGERANDRIPPTTLDEPKKKPTKSDGEGQINCRDAVVRPPRRLSGRFERVCRVYDPRAKDFGAEVFEAMKLPHLPTSLEGRRELGNFAAAWSLAQASGLSYQQLEELWYKAIKSAKELGNKRRRVTFTKSPEAVWRWVFNKRLDKAKAESRSGRAAV